MAYKTISTFYGLSRMAAAATGGSPINLVQVAIGDGAGNEVTLDRGQINIVGERLRRPVSRIYQLADDPTVFIVECTIPADVAGFTIRTAGIYDDNQALVAVCNTPEMYKPHTSEGAVADFVFSMMYKATNDSVVSITVDPNVAVASRAWVMNILTPATLLPGGTTGQVARKRSNADGDIEWADPTDVNVVSSTIEETQTLAANQTIVNLNRTTVQGLALYVNGTRLRNDEWEPDAILPSRLTLGAARAAGSKLTAVQNEPAGALTDPLAKAKNLSDVPNKETARVNLDVFSKAETAALRRYWPGDIFYTAAASPPAFSMRANGAEVSRTVYADTFARLGTRYGAGDGFNTFNLPDGRGVFIRGLDDGRGIDPGRALGSIQWDALQNITGTFVMDDQGAERASGAFALGAPTGSGAVNDSVGRVLTFDASRVARTAGETRPTNIAFLCCVAF